MSELAEGGRAGDGPLVIGYDGSEDARRAIAFAASLFPGREAVILAIASPITPGEALTETFGVAQNYEEVNDSEALAIAAGGAERARRSGLIARAQAEIAAPTWQGILDVADEVGATVIVVGSRGRTAARELLEGSVSHEVAAHAHRPVMIVPTHGGSAPHRSSLLRSRHPRTSRPDLEAL